MKLRKRFESRRTRKNFNRKLFRIRYVSEKICVRDSHRIVKIFARKTIFQIPNFIITGKIILQKSPSSNNYFTFFIVNINERLCTLCIGHFTWIPADFFAQNSRIFLKKIFKSREQNIVWHNDNQVFFEKRHQKFRRNNLIF